MFRAQKSDLAAFIKGALPLSSQGHSEFDKHLDE
jgi:hypothetical protein